MAEKYLKVFLIFNSDFSSIDPLNLSDFGVSVRYPGDQYSPSEKEVLEYKEIAFEIERMVLLSLKLIV